MTEFFLNITYEEHILLLIGAIYGLLLNIGFKFFMKLKLNKILNLFINNLIFYSSIALIIFVAITYKGDIDLIIVGLFVVSLGLVFCVFILKNFIKMQKQLNGILKIALDNDLEILKNSYKSDIEILKKFYKDDSEVVKVLLDKIKEDESTNTGKGSEK